MSAPAPPFEPHLAKMTPASDFEIFLVTAPGLEAALCAEARERRFRDPKIVKGGVTVQGGWPEVWRANLELRGASRVLARIAEFRAMHPAQLDKRAHKVAWGEILRADVPFRVDAACKASRIYHEGAAAQRIAKAIRDTVGAPETEDAEVVIKARIDDDLCTISVDTSGESLHKRGHKQAVAKAPEHQLITLDDVGAYAAFLASDAARSITGNICYVDAGYHVVG